MKKIILIYREMRQIFFFFDGHFGFSGKAEPKVEGLTTKFHHLLLKTDMCTEFGTFVRPINDAKELINIYSGMVTNT